MPFMARRADAPSKMDVLILSSLARTPMHGYELKLELRYKHVRWWAKCEHGHLYAALTRLERRGFLRRAGARNGGRRRVYTLTPTGLARLRTMLTEVGVTPDTVYFDVDLFLSGAFVLDRDEALDILARRRAALAGQLAEATALRSEMSTFVPTVGRLIIDHRIDHIEREIAFSERAEEALRAEAAWGSFLGRDHIGDFVERTGVPLEGNDDRPRRRRR